MREERKGRRRCEIATDRLLAIHHPSPKNNPHQQRTIQKDVCRRRWCYELGADVRLPLHGRYCYCRRLVLVDLRFRHLALGLIRQQFAALPQGYPSNFSPEDCSPLLNRRIGSKVGAQIQESSAASFFPVPSSARRMLKIQQQKWSCGEELDCSSRAWLLRCLFCCVARSSLLLASLVVFGRGELW